MSWDGQLNLWVQPQGTTGIVKITDFGVSGELEDDLEQTKKVTFAQSSGMFFGVLWELCGFVRVKCWEAGVQRDCHVAFVALSVP